MTTGEWGKFEHFLNPEDDNDMALVMVDAFQDEDGQELTNAAGVELILGVWAAQGDADREWCKTMGHDYVMAFSDGSGLSLSEWSEANDGTYYLNEAPVVRA